MANIKPTLRPTGRGKGFGERTRRVLSASSLAGDRVRNTAGENLGKIEEIMIDIPSGRVAYAVLSFGGFLGMGNKLFAVPWNAFTIDEENKEFILDVDKRSSRTRRGSTKTTGRTWPIRTSAGRSSVITATRLTGKRK